MPTLTERLREMLAEAGGEREQLEARRGELVAERDAKLDEVRRDYAARIASIDADLQTAKRIERALEPPEARAKYGHPKDAAKGAPKRAPAGTRKPEFRPSEKIMRGVLAALETGHETIPAITEVVEFSRGSVENAVPWLRDDGLIRLAGQTKAGNSNAKVRKFKLTPAGTEYLEQTAEVVSNGAPA